MLDGLRAIVVSIGKLAVGQADYYLEQAQARVDRATSVGSGVEDYYVGGTEAPGYWLGAGSARLGIVGPGRARRADARARGPRPDERAGARAGRMRAGCRGST